MGATSARREGSPMTFTAAPHLYIQSDLPEGQTLLEWRRERHARRPRRSFLQRMTGSTT